MRANILTAVTTTLLAAVPAAQAAGSSPAQAIPQALHAAYALPRTVSHPPTVAVVVAYDDPTLAGDLRVFARRFSLPACTSVSRCLRRVNQRGQLTPLPPADPTGGKWTTETALSTETLHGICQNCRLLVVEADSESPGDLAAAVDTAARLGAREIVTTYTFSEGLFDSAAAKYYDHPGVVITAAAGDDGFQYATNVPAVYPGVVAVGGTTLKLGRGDRWAGEAVWNSSIGSTASGCSAFTLAPSWEAPYAARSGCGKRRSVPDVAAAAGPAPLYSSTSVDSQGHRGWFEADGTSVSSPIVAGVFALAGRIRRGQSAAAILYAHSRTTPGAFHDVTRGSNGSSCGAASICHARRGYDGVTGVGTPHGLAGFRAGRT